MSDATDWDEARAERAAEVEAQYGHPDDHICTRCHGDGYVTSFYGEPEDCPRCGLSGLEPNTTTDAPRPPRRRDAITEGR